MINADSRSDQRLVFSMITSDVEQTWRVGEALGRLLEPGDVICLYGDLGSGKTNLSYGISRGLEVKDEYITSPTFTFVNEYQGRIPFYHIDLYRLKDVVELENIGFEKYIDSEGATVIEWAERAEDALPNVCLNVYLSYNEDDKREIGFYAEGERYQKILEQLKSTLK
jgi:tRNA threonylcarbamoyladenosine biosynthesis protein TsaE